ncbi:MAG TPA: DUF1844 domain-containing protein [Terriglobales bacterium]|nr:DUF1844 domain-containing protein [Terriglobales bacterium]
MADTNSQHEEPVLKVSDRRHFTESGERRADVDQKEYEERPAPAPPPPAAAAQAKPATPAAPETAKPAAPPRPERLAARDITFAGLLQDLYATAMMQMGAELQPGQPGQVDIEGARETIDLLGMLQQKTHGNRDPQEEQLMSAVLYDLRLAYVELMRAATRMPPLPPPPGARKR